MNHELILINTRLNSQFVREIFRYRILPHTYIGPDLSHKNFIVEHVSHSAHSHFRLYNTILSHHTNAKHHRHTNFMNDSRYPHHRFGVKKKVNEAKKIDLPNVFKFWMDIRYTNNKRIKINCLQAMRFVFLHL